MTDNAIETFDLTKIYSLKGKKKELIALDKVNLSIKKGEIYGILGPNGAGKTTLIQILTTLIQPTSGYAKVYEENILKNPKNAKSKIALMLDWKMLYYRVTAYDNLEFFCRIYEIPNFKEKIFKIVKEFGLEKWLFQYVENFSSGMKIKLALCRTILLERPILFLDEPTLGLDVTSVSFIVDKIKSLNKTILLTSHDMNVVEKLCDRIAFINKGKIMKIGTKEDLKKIEQNTIKIEIGIKEGKDQLKSELNSLNFIIDIVEKKSGFLINIKERKFYQNLCQNLGRYRVNKIKEHDLSLEDLFLRFIE